MVTVYMGVHGTGISLRLFTGIVFSRAIVLQDAGKINTRHKTDNEQ